MPPGSALLYYIALHCTVLDTAVSLHSTMHYMKVLQFSLFGQIRLYLFFSLVISLMCVDAFNSMISNSKATWIQLAGR